MPADDAPTSEARPVSSILISVEAQAWTLFGRGFGPMRTVALRITLLEGGGVQVVRADGRRLGHIARTCREPIEQARAEMELQRKREAASATKRTTRHTPPRRAEAVIRTTPVPGQAPAAEAEPAQPAKVGTGVFRVDKQTVTDRITRLRKERPEAAPALERLTPAEAIRREEQTRAVARIRELREQAHRDHKGDGSDVFSASDAAAGELPPPEKTTSGMFKYNREQITDRITKLRKKGDSGTWDANGAEK